MSTVTIDLSQESQKKRTALKLSFGAFIASIMVGGSVSVTAIIIGSLKSHDKCENFSTLNIWLIVVGILSCINSSLWSVGFLQLIREIGNDDKYGKSKTGQYVGFLMLLIAIFDIVGIGLLIYDQLTCSNIDPSLLGYTIFMIIIGLFSFFLCISCSCSRRNEERT